MLWAHGGCQSRSSRRIPSLCRPDWHRLAGETNTDLDRLGPKQLTRRCLAVDRFSKRILYSYHAQCPVSCSGWRIANHAIINDDHLLVFWPHGLAGTTVLVVDLPELNKIA